MKGEAVFMISLIKFVSEDLLDSNDFITILYDSFRRVKGDIKNDNTKQNRRYSVIDSKLDSRASQKNNDTV